MDVFFFSSEVTEAEEKMLPWIRDDNDIFPKFFPLVQDRVVLSDMIRADGLHATGL